MTNFQRTSAWLHACGKTPDQHNLSVQIGCHIEEFIEFLDQLELEDVINTKAHLTVAVELLEHVAHALKRRHAIARIHSDSRERALDALCDQEVTLNGIAYLAGFRKDEADQAVLSANEAKLVDGKPVILPGGKIGKPEGWQPPKLGPFV
jgi:predicted HAD superfamily Cof-like phosphohydrolase